MIGCSKSSCTDSLLPLDPADNSPLRTLPCAINSLCFKGQPGDLHTQGLQPSPQGLVMLLGKNLGRRRDGRLVTRVDGPQRGRGRHHDLVSPRPRQRLDHQSRVEVAVVVRDEHRRAEHRFGTLRRRNRREEVADVVEVRRAGRQRTAGPATL